MTRQGRIRRVRGDVSPTSSAELRYTVTDRDPSPHRVARPRRYDPDIPVKEPPATCSAEAEIRYRDVQGRFTVPPRQAGHLLNLMASVTGIAGVLLGCAVILRFFVGAPSGLIALLTGLCVLVIAALAGITIFRNRS